MGGSVGVTSTPGSGSRFFLRLPLITATELSLPETPLPPATVLLVEDMDYNAWAATAVLAKLGLSCERASTGEEALRLFREKRFNVVLLDRNLPDMDGLDVARRMREHEAGESPAILLGVTAYCTAEDRALCLEAGMDAFVGKPITPKKLRRVLIAAGRRLLTSATADLDHQPQTQTDVDFTVLNYLSDGSVDGLQDQVVRFLASLEGEYADATRAHLADDANHLATLAHRLHGQAKLVGHSALLDAAKNLQTIARSGTRSQRQEGLASVRKEIDALTAIMRSVQPVLTAT
jgi:CheY-like chemotaxis protein